MMTYSRLLSALCALCLGALLTSCESPLPEVSYPELRFNHLPAIKLDVARIEIIERYQSPLRPPNVEHQIPLAPALTMRNWATDRLRAVGKSGVAKFIIIDASVKAQTLAKKKGVKAIFTVNQVMRYDAMLEARLEVETSGGLGKGFATAQASRQRTLSEGVSINERNDALYSFVEATAKDFDQVMAKNINDHMAPFRR